MIDLVDYRLPFGPLGAIADRLVVGGYLSQLLETRNRYIKQLAEATT